MKPEIQSKLKSATAELIRSTIASPWFWQRLPRTRSAKVRKERSKLQRAAAKAQGDPVRFVEDIFGSSFFATDSKLRESASVALYEIIAECTRWIQSAEAIAEFVASNKSERRVVGLMRDLFVSLDSRPGRPQQDKYREAAAFLARNGKTSSHRLCILYEPEYLSMDRKQQEQARKRMSAGANRISRQAATRSDEIPLSIS